MRLVWMVIAAAGLIACRQVEPAPVNTGFVLFEATTEAQGMEILDGLDSMLSEGARNLLQVKSATGNGGVMMVRFGGTCRANTAFVAEVRVAVERRGATNVQCTAELPDKAAA